MNKDAPAEDQGGERSGSGPIPYGQLLLDDIFLLLGLNVTIAVGFYIVWGLLNISGTPPFPELIGAPAQTASQVQAATRAQAATGPAVPNAPAEVPVRATGSASAAFKLVASEDQANAGFNFNGGTKGHPVITVPVGAEVELTLVNRGNTPHSVQIIPYAVTPPLTALAQPAFSGAQTPSPLAGTPPGQSAGARFTANRPGRYLLICGVPGHALAGMYGILEVSESVSIKPTVVAK
jgi:sulfocyanin